MFRVGTWRAISPGDQTHQDFPLEISAFGVRSPLTSGQSSPSIDVDAEWLVFRLVRSRRNCSKWRNVDEASELA
jgi:hypothetical protein